MSPVNYEVVRLPGDAMKSIVQAREEEEEEEAKYRVGVHTLFKRETLLWLQFVPGSLSFFLSLFLSFSLSLFHRSNQKRKCVS